jgi:hypothetical protein
MLVMVTLISVGLVACTSLGATTAEVVNVDLQPRAVGPARWDGHACASPNGRLYRYRVHVQNTGDRSIYVAQCALTATDDPGNAYSSTGSAGTFPAGTSIQPGRDANLDGRVAFLIEGQPQRTLEVTAISCEAWDWHDHPPI